jgi:hypothetical protein
MMSASRDMFCGVSDWRIASNENKMSDGGRHRASLGVKGWKSSQKVEHPAVRRSLHRMVRCFVVRTKHTHVDTRLVRQNHLSNANRRHRCESPT